MSKKKNTSSKAKKETPTKATKKGPDKPVKEPKKRKKHKGLIIFLVIFGILVVLPVGFVFGAFYETGTKEVSNSEVTYQNIVSQSFHNGIKDLSEDKPKLNFMIDEDMIDGIMMAACDKIGQEKFIPKMYCEIKDNQYTFYADLQASFFKTRVIISTQLLKEGEGINRQLVFKINEVKIGRLPIPLNWVTGILSNFLNDSTLNNAFAQAGFHIESHLSEAKLTYNRKQFQEDVGNYVSKLGGNNPFLNILLTMFGDEEHEVLKTNYHNGVTATFDLTQLQLTEGTYSEPPLQFTELQLDQHKEKIIEWLNSNVLEEGNADDMFTYLVRGDTDTSFIADDLKTKVEEYIGTTVDNYKGSKIKNQSEERFADYCASDIAATFEINTDHLIENPPKFSISSDDINKYLAHDMTEAVGKTIQITNVNSDGTWNFDYVLIDNFYTEFIKDNGDVFMNLYLNINISGVPVTARIRTNNITITDTVPGEGGEDDWALGNLSFTMKDIYFGQIPIDDGSFKDYIIDLLPDSSDGTQFVFDKQKGEFKINLDSIQTVKEAIEQVPTQYQVRKTLLEIINEASKNPNRDVINNDFTITYNYPSP
ncbi:MAG: hypothetical protein MJ213_00930 [Bacilli bacterium]|nr:hypothetical protein [Bacilli bacterium]